MRAASGESVGWWNMSTGMMTINHEGISMIVEEL